MAGRSFIVSLSSGQDRLSRAAESSESSESILPYHINREKCSTTKMKLFASSLTLAAVLASASASTGTTTTTIDADTVPSDIVVEVSSAQEGSKPEVKVVDSSTGLNLNRVMQAIEIFEFITKFSNSAQDGFGITKVHSTSLTYEDTPGDSSEARTHEKRSSSAGAGASGSDLMKTIDPVTMLLSAVVFAASKLSALMITWFVYLSQTVMPENEYFRYNDHYYHVDYNTISDSIKQLPAKGFNMFDIREEECQSRAMCEIGQSIGGFFPEVAKWLRFVVERMNLKDLNSEAIVRGFGWKDCEKSFKKTCPKSPFKKLEQLIAMAKVHFY